MIKTFINKADNAIATFVFAHGAGAGQSSDFMALVAEGISQHHINVVRFNFAYMQLAEELGRRRPPDRADKLIIHYKSVLSELSSCVPVFIGGKSMGGRIASMLLEDSNAKGCICMGYPFHPPAKPKKLRTEHLQNLQKPLLVLQGERDNFGTKDEIDGYLMSSNVQVIYLTDGDHSFKPRKKSGVTLAQNINNAVQESVMFINRNL
ncbi:alpha/beta family hydrolase [Paraglaciecola sp.]|uniref:alpha/beta family hydrolase n=1 Tax=Paraglaciecola sp. TaxID=1920173 RepID=UPI00326620D2